MLHASDLGHYSTHGCFNTIAGKMLPTEVERKEYPGKLSTGKHQR